jgi:hypothetical protein
MKLFLSGMGAAYCFLEFEEERDAEVNRVLDKRDRFSEFKLKIKKNNSF